ncbi:MAG: hypothetical protein A3H52_02645 [Candidatus Zambryskibacteria bacterium RIFCSPLOWO2_02_FULL_39_26]|uniref:DUF5671 domain-containing protein n=1 Tax=Candidatus Zambryskibacteria bacterium RIFCSPLOWO2_12_FULL_39_23 TaxID=1802776 RepID=A0A1G2UTJ7_9BACT|nr:MAG: hypothetical protein A3E59_01045 [Candidatus Zambryskibacteria bacterium RIFCSPHIGHO2_12_FULL_39_47]OHB10352.1 MAG: hypothetical protein A3H52_02645 [Candidatus Zambryskibacteria bacterium RIFCSPLOWO2_02_FULL_39_26]OHB12729.1 MAG: hypothetical protein A3G99_01510 [Candidatus Zambryskibacteria bacterium RIFCSPLOWO2_12_FULL_39_23]
MESQRNRTKDFFLDVAATVALYTLVISLLNLLFTVINRAYPKIGNSYQYFGSQSISWPVAILVILFPIFIYLMWYIGRNMNEERKNSGIHKFLTYLTVFIAGAVVAGDLVTVLYYFIDGQELTAGFLLKVLAIIVVVGSVFMYYISDIKGKLTGTSRNFWRSFAFIVAIGSIVWGFSVLGSPRTQRLYKYDDQKISDLANIKGAVENHYTISGALPTALDSLDLNYYFSKVDSQTQKSYEYKKISDLKYELCAEFNKASDKALSQVYMYGNVSWNHQAGRYCFTQTINPNTYSKPIPAR